MKVRVASERRGRITIDEIRRQVRCQLKYNIDEYQNNSGEVDQKKLSNNIRKILGLYGVGWDGHNKYYQVEFQMINPTIYSVMIDLDRKSTRLNSSHTVISYAVFCLKKKK